MKKLLLSSLFLAGVGCTQPKETPKLEAITNEVKPGAALVTPATPQPLAAPVALGCGNGIRELLTPPNNNTTEKPEECDSTMRGCDQKYCVLNQCGDGTLDPEESCDDGNMNSKDGCSNRCELELNSPDDTFASADKHPLTINKESVFVGSLREKPDKGEADYVAFTISFPAELVVIDHGFYSCGLSTTKTTLYDKDKKELWSVQEFPTTRTVTLQPGTYYLGLFFEAQEYMLWFKDTRPTPTKS